MYTLQRHFLASLNQSSQKPMVVKHCHRAAVTFNHTCFYWKQLHFKKKKNIMDYSISIETWHYNLQKKKCTTMTNCQLHWEHYHETVLTSTEIFQRARTLMSKHCTSTFDHKSTALQFLMTWLGMYENLFHQIVRNVRNIDIQTTQQIYF